MKGHQVTFLPERKLECGDIAVSCKNLGIAGDEPVVEKGKKAGGAIPSPYTENCADLVVGKHGMEVPGALFIGAGKIAMRFRDVLSERNAVSQSFEVTDATVDF
jgi:hypothetical protein